MQIMLFVAAAGIAGMGLGALISVLLFKKPSEEILCWLLSFAGGVMISIVCFGLVPEAFKLANTIICLSGLILGILIIMALNYLIDRITEPKEEKIKIHHTHEEMYHANQFINNRATMLRSGFLMLFAISLHNIPEGMAIGAGGSHNFQLGVLLSIMIGMHNIPEGMAIAAPLLAGGIGKSKVILWTSLAGATTLLGGFIGAAIGSLSDTAVALSLASAGGAMLYIVFGEIIPQSVVMTQKRTAPVITLFGIIIGLVVTRL